MLDPYADECEIASLLGKLLNCETLGCELFPFRAEKAALAGFPEIDHTQDGAP